MSWIVQNLWLIPFLPLAGAAVLALAGKAHRTLAAGISVVTMASALVLSCWAFGETLGYQGTGEVVRQTVQFTWMDLGAFQVNLGWVLDPLAAIMLMMVSLVGLMIFIYSIGYMAHDDNFVRFFCFLCLFAAAMLTVVIANHLLLFFAGWELMGLASYLLIGFWFFKPSAAAAAKKAFITTRIGDIGFFLGMLWLYSASGTLTFYDHGNGCLEKAGQLFALTTRGGFAVATGISLLILCGAIGKSGQLPLHVWLPDAMEGPTPVSALIHAATMVAAGVFLVARVYPIMSGPAVMGGHSAALVALTWVGALTALFAASVAVAQTDIKRILAYSTVSQLGYMMMGLGAGGIAIGMFHLITHAFFKALLFLGAGSVIHGCHDEQDIRNMGGLRRVMPVTFATYAVGMMALSGVPLFFSGFWSKDEILASLHHWNVSQWPFYLGLASAFLTAFYMTRQVCYVFFGRGRTPSGAQQRHSHPHESPRVMTAPLVVLAAGSVLMGFVGTPAWPWFHAYLTGEPAHFEFGRLFERGFLALLIFSSLVLVASGFVLGWWLYGDRAEAADDIDALERLHPEIFNVLRRKFYFDELYQATILQWHAGSARICDWMDRMIWGGCVTLISLAVVAFAWVDRLIDEYVINLGFKEGCFGLRRGGALLSRVSDGRVQDYLRWIGIGLAVLLIVAVSWRTFA